MLLDGRGKSHQDVILLSTIGEPWWLKSHVIGDCGRNWRVYFEKTKLRMFSTDDQFNKWYDITRYSVAQIE